MRGHRSSLLLLALLLLPLALPAQPAIRKYLDKPGFHWKCAALPHIDFCFPDDMESDHEIAAAKRDLEPMLAHTLRLAGAAAYTPRIHIFLAESYSRIRDLVGAYAAGASVPSEHFVVFAVRHYEALAHELHHEVFTTLWGPSEPWIAEGYAAWAAEPDKVDAQCRAVLEGRQSLPLELLVSPSWQAAMYSSDVTYPELGSFVKYLQTRYGAPILRQLWRSGAKAIPQLTSSTFPSLKSDWRKSLMTHR